jgi:hypothetical protein
MNIPMVAADEPTRPGLAVAINLALALKLVWSPWLVEWPTPGRPLP